MCAVTLDMLTYLIFYRRCRRSCNICKCSRMVTRMEHLREEEEGAGSLTGRINNHCCPTRSSNKDTAYMYRTLTQGTER